MPTKAKDDNTSTLRINDSVKRELLKISGELMAKDGVSRSFQDVIEYLISEYRK